MKRINVIPSELLGSAIAWESLRCEWWQQQGREVGEIKTRINGLNRRLKTESKSTSKD